MSTRNVVLGIVVALPILCPLQPPTALYSTLICTIVLVRKNGLASYSKHHIDNAFIDVPISDQVHGIFGVTLSEMLHVMGNGLSKYMFQSVHDTIGANDQKRKKKEDF